MTAPLLEVDNLGVEVGPRERPLKLVNGVSFEVGAGESVGLVGESGSGKSMTALAIMRLVSQPPIRLTGAIRFNGTDLLSLPKNKLPDMRGRDIAMIFQEPMSSLNPVMRIGDQIGEAILLHERMSSDERRKRVIEMLRLVGIPSPETRLDAYPHEFSGGMRQRVMIAMALSCNPKLLIADEPTTALDVTIQAQVLEVIRSIRERLNTSVLLISHDLGVIAEVCDRVAVIYAGHIVEHADVKTIFTAPRHPYTKGLLQSIPRMHDERRRLYQIPGAVPTAGSITEGCPFRDRCPERLPRCDTEMPPMTSFGPRHGAACWAAMAEKEAVQ